MHKCTHFFGTHETEQINKDVKSETTNDNKQVWSGTDRQKGKQQSELLSKTKLQNKLDKHWNVQVLYQQYNTRNMNRHRFDNKK